MSVTIIRLIKPLLSHSLATARMTIFDLIRHQDWLTLSKRDELNNEIRQGHILSHFQSPSVPAYPPTYPRTLKLAYPVITAGDDGSGLLSPSGSVDNTNVRTPLPTPSPRSSSSSRSVMVKVDTYFSLSTGNTLSGGGSNNNNMLPGYADRILFHSSPACTGHITTLFHDLAEMTLSSSHKPVRAGFEITLTKGKEDILIYRDLVPLSTSSPVSNKTISSKSMSSKHQQPATRILINTEETRVLRLRLSELTIQETQKGKFIGNISIGVGSDPDSLILHNFHNYGSSTGSSVNSKKSNVNNKSNTTISSSSAGSFPPRFVSTMTVTKEIEKMDWDQSLSWFSTPIGTGNGGSGSSGMNPFTHSTSNSNPSTPRDTLSPLPTSNSTGSIFTFGNNSIYRNGISSDEDSMELLLSSLDLPGIAQNASLVFAIFASPKTTVFGATTRKIDARVNNTTPTSVSSNNGNTVGESSTSVFYYEESATTTSTKSTSSLHPGNTTATTSTDKHRNKQLIASTSLSLRNLFISLILKQKHFYHFKNLPLIRNTEIIGNISGKVCLDDELFNFKDYLNTIKLVVNERQRRIAVSQGIPRPLTEMSAKLVPLSQLPGSSVSASTVAGVNARMKTLAAIVEGLRQQAMARLMKKQRDAEKEKGIGGVVGGEGESEWVLAEGDGEDCDKETEKGSDCDEVVDQSCWTDCQHALECTVC